MELDRKERKGREARARFVISCLCPTYGRCPSYQHLLEEAVESFLRQDRHVESELIVLNDCPQQELICEARNVRIVNLPYRLPTLGDKFNLLVELARGDVLLPWEDDDISLPNRIGQAVAQLGGDDYWKPPQVWFLSPGTAPIWRHNVGVRHHASVFTRSAWREAGGYPRISGAQDAAMDSQLMSLRQRIEHFPNGLEPNQWQYIYRWGVSPNHLSGNSDHEAAYRTEAEKSHVAGQFKLLPHWRADYLELTRI
jgi:glycosyltransferase involved in cell wall biosynthesis